MTTASTKGTRWRWQILLVLATMLWLTPTAGFAQDGLSEDALEEQNEQPDEVVPVHLQDVVNNPEYGPDNQAKKPTKAQPLRLDFKLQSEIHSYNNRDLLMLNEASDQDVINTDDRHTFAYSTLLGRVQYLITDGLRVGVSVAHNGLWGEDQIGESAINVGIFSFYELAAHYTPLSTKAIELTFSLGRQPFSIGDVSRDYVLDDVLDSLVLTADFRKGGRLRLLAFDYFTSNDLPSASFASYIGGRSPVLGLRGDTFTLRTGGIYENVDAILKGLMVKAYFFYADIGGGALTETGADITYGGSLGNFSDNDWAAIGGGRAGYNVGLIPEQIALKFFAEVSYSFGIDRKEAVARDVDIAGLMAGGGLEFEYDLPSKAFGATVAADFYHFDGAEYDESGLMSSYGYVSFKGRQVGGLAIDRYSGWHPSAFLGSGGVEYSPQDLDHTGGTQFIHAALQLRALERIKLQVDYWKYLDTSSSSVNQDQLQSLNPPFGYSREEFAAQSRLGRDLGSEINVQLSWAVNDYLNLYSTGGIYLPGEFQLIPINRVAGTSLGGQEPLWGVMGGASVSWDNVDADKD